jgi:hypothetical protein
MLVLTQGVGQCQSCPQRGQGKIMSKAPKTVRIGLNCALSTPFTKAGAIDLGKLVAHANWVLENGCDGITVFGTTGEGASIAVPERHQVLGALGASGIDLRTKVQRLPKPAHRAGS